MYHGTFQNKETHYGRCFHRTEDLKVYPFGWTKIIYMPLEFRKNLDFPAERNVLVGLAEEQLYKFYCNETKGIFHARCVDETFCLIALPSLKKLNKI